jgi:hypothetical protein
MIVWAALISMQADWLHDSDGHDHVNVLSFQHQSVKLRDLFTASDADRILGEKTHLKDSSFKVKNEVTEYQCAYMANVKDKKTERTGSIYVMIEEYKEIASARDLYASIKTSNEGHEGIQTIDNLGDEAYFHSDQQNFYFILVRKRGKLLRMKVNKITSNTSVDQFNQVAKELTCRM